MLSREPLTIEVVVQTIKKKFLRAFAERAGVLARLLTKSFRPLFSCVANISCKSHNFILPSLCPRGSQAIQIDSSLTLHLTDQNVLENLFKKYRKRYWFKDLGNKFCWELSGCFLISLWCLRRFGHSYLSQRDKSSIWKFSQYKYIQNFLRWYFLQRPTYSRNRDGLYEILNMKGYLRSISLTPMMNLKSKKTIDNQRRK